MKILIMSDSHGNGRRVKEIVQREQPDHTIHCGDFCTDLAELPKTSLTVVKGNCDWERVPEEDIWLVEGLRFYATHGHLFRVKTSPLPLKYHAAEKEAQIVCFGHSHYPMCEQVDGRLYINPGSIQKPRGVAYPTYVTLQIEPNHQVTVRFHQVDGTITDRGGVFLF